MLLDIPLVSVCLFHSVLLSLILHVSRLCSLALSFADTLITLIPGKFAFDPGDTMILQEFLAANKQAKRKKPRSQEPERDATKQPKNRLDAETIERTQRPRMIKV